MDVNIDEVAALADAFIKNTKCYNEWCYRRRAPLILHRLWVKEDSDYMEWDILFHVRYLLKDKIMRLKITKAYWSQSPLRPKDNQNQSGQYLMHAGAETDPAIEPSNPWL